MVLTDRFRKIAEERDALRRKLEAECSVPHSHPRAELLFDLAWEYGHAGGDAEVDYYYGDMYRLLAELEREEPSDD